MHPLVQSATAALKQGDKNKAGELIEQALHANPNDIEALLILATIVDQSPLKRQILNRVLSLDATNKAAREMMLEMDRAEINSYRSSSTGDSASQAQSQLDASRSSQSSLPHKGSTISLDKPMQFRYPSALMAILYVFTTLSCCGSLWFATINITFSFPFLALFIAMTLVLGINSLTVSCRVEANEKVIRVSSLLRSVEMDWSEIANIKFDPLRRNLELSSTIGQLVTISTEMGGYKTIIEILRQKRSDLFTESIFFPKGAVESPRRSVPPPSNSYEQSISTAGSDGPPDLASTTLAVPSQPIPSVPRLQTLPPLTSSDLGIEKPLIFRYSTVWLIVLYLFATIFLCIGLLVASQRMINGLPTLGLALVFGITALSNSSKVEIRESGIQTSNLLSKAEMRWSEIIEVKSNSAGKKLELRSKNDEILKISSQLQGYPVIVEILRQKRSDLFNRQASSATEKSLTEAGYSPSLSQNLGASTFGETTTFRKSFLKQYGLALVGLVFCILFVWLASVSSENRTAFLVTGAFCALLIIIPFFQVSAVRVEANKLMIETFFEQKEFAARQIKEIKIQPIRGRYGRVTNIVNIIPTEGRSYPLGGFRDGDEVVYGILMNWWSTYQNQ